MKRHQEELEAVKSPQAAADEDEAEEEETCCSTIKHRKHFTAFRNMVSHRRGRKSTQCFHQLNSTEYLLYTQTHANHCQLFSLVKPDLGSVPVPLHVHHSLVSVHQPVWKVIKQIYSDDMRKQSYD